MNRFSEDIDLTVEETQKVLNAIRDRIILLNQIKDLEERFGTTDIEKLLDEADKEAEDPNTKFLTLEEVLEKARKILNGEK